jgi:transposase
MFPPETNRIHQENPTGGNKHMMTFTLDLSRKIVVELQNELDKARQNGNWVRCQKINAVFAFSEGYGVSTIADILNVGISSVYDWIKVFLQKGIRGLREKYSSGRPSKLTKTEKKRLAKLVDVGPEACGFISSCWRSPMLQELIHREFGIFYSVHYISELLKNMGFSFQKARFVAANQDEEAREKWLKNEWPRILRQANSQDAYLLFGDEASFPQWGSLNYTWARRGQQPVVKTSGSRKAYKVFGLIDYFSGKLFAKGHLGKLNADTYIAFLTEVLAKTRKQIILIQDGASYHKGSKMTEFFENNKHRLTVYRLPTYSPDFNPIEGLWKKIKQMGTHLKYFPTFESLIDRVEEMLIEFKNATAEVLALFGFYTKAKKC